MSNPLLNLAAKTAQILPPAFRRGLYRLGPITRLIRGTLNRAVPGGLSDVTIAAGLNKGKQFSLNLHAEKDYWLGTYEPELQEALREFVKPSMTAYDVGANIGYITVMLAALIGENGRVHAFEALPKNVARLKNNIALNNLKNVEFHHAAVAGGQDSVQFQVHPSHGMGKAAGSAGRDESYLQTITVPGLSLDNFPQNHSPPDIIKMDIEGGEVLALPAARRVLTEYRPILFLELHGEEAARVAWDTLTEANYSLHEMKTGMPSIQSLGDLNWKAYVVARPL